MKTLFLALGFVVALAPAATLKGEATTLTDVTTLTGRPTADTVTVTLVRWPFT